MLAAQQGCDVQEQYRLGLGLQLPQAKTGNNRVPPHSGWTCAPDCTPLQIQQHCPDRKSKAGRWPDAMPGRLSRRNLAGLWIPMDTYGHKPVPPSALIQAAGVFYNDALRKAIEKARRTCGRAYKPAHRPVSATGRASFRTDRYTSIALYPDRDWAF